MSNHPDRASGSEALEDVMQSARFFLQQIEQMLKGAAESSELKEDHFRLILDTVRSGLFRMLQQTEAALKVGQGDIEKLKAIPLPDFTPSIARWLTTLKNGPLLRRVVDYLGFRLGMTSKRIAYRSGISPTFISSDLQWVRPESPRRGWSARSEPTQLDKLITWLTAELDQLIAAERAALEAARRENPSP